ncbi:hypothetical protein DQ04_04721010 [Trypanosoma grayi]|uniref:hypothetical protein n=1 Tax=Trypanosoma grayi TaxID=71804 RepID=UPI0004F45613|nr:hypothetical protein DQ04_04721010 [Trypanosoma grayi]KEG09740.1 hypothetical protein DQ04_04721010 [Trypanosoma grayi]
MAELDCGRLSLPLESAPGPDMIHGEALRHLGKCAKHSVLTLFKKDLRTGVVPQGLKKRFAILVFKQGKKAIRIEPHRPVKLTGGLFKPTGCTIAERISGDDIGAPLC